MSVAPGIIPNLLVQRLQCQSDKRSLKFTNQFQPLDNMEILIARGLFFSFFFMFVS